MQQRGGVPFGSSEKRTSLHKPLWGWHGPPRFSAIVLIKTTVRFCLAPLAYCATVLRDIDELWNESRGGIVQHQDVAPSKGDGR